MIICVWKPNNSRGAAHPLNRSGMNLVFESCRVGLLMVGELAYISSLNRP